MSRDGRRGISQKVNQRGPWAQALRSLTPRSISKHDCSSPRPLSSSRFGESFKGAWEGRGCRTAVGWTWAGRETRWVSGSKGSSRSEGVEKKQRGLEIGAQDGGRTQPGMLGSGPAQPYAPLASKNGCSSPRPFSSSCLGESCFRT
jgi:hypothetical protein